LGEGVVFDASGRLFYSDAFDNAIMEVKPDGITAVWSREVRMPNAPQGAR
jgi:sugar lactone lactonase YvrE